MQKVAGVVPRVIVSGMTFGSFHYYGEFGVIA